MTDGSPKMLPLVPPAGGAEVDAEGGPVAGPAIVTQPPPEPFDNERPDNSVLRLRVSEDVEVLEARLTVGGSGHTADLSASVSVSSGQATLDFDAPRPVSRITYSKANGSASSTLSLRVGGIWVQPPDTGGVDLDDLPSGTRFPDLLSDQFLLTNANSVSNVESRTFPANVTLRLGDGGAPFFFHSGDLRQPPVAVPDFGAQLDLALRECEPRNGNCTVDVIAHSDTFGRVDSQSAGFAVRLRHNALEGLSLADRTVTVPSEGDASLPLAIGTGLTRPVGRPAVHGVSLGVVATTFGPAFAQAQNQHAPLVSNGFQVAQAFRTDQSMSITAVALLLRRRRPATSMRLELRAEVEGEPRGEVLAAADDPAALSESYGWNTLQLDTAVEVANGTRLWLRLACEEGEILWRGGPPSPANVPVARFSTDNGNTWRDHPVATEFVLIVEPAETTPASLALSVAGQTQSLALDADAGFQNFDAASPLVAGINTALEAAAPASGMSLPAKLDLSLGNQTTLARQVVFTRFDVVYTQTT